MITANDFISDNLTMTGPDQGSSSPLRRILRAPFTRRTWDELAYSVSSLLLALGALIFIVPTLANGLLWALSAPGVRKLGAASRFLAGELIRGAGRQAEAAMHARVGELPKRLVHRASCLGVGGCQD